MEKLQLIKKIEIEFLEGEKLNLNEIAALVLWKESDILDFDNWFYCEAFQNQPNKKITEQLENKSFEDLDEIYYRLSCGYTRFCEKTKTFVIFLENHQEN